MGDYNEALLRNRDAAVQARTKAQNRANVLQLKLIGQSHPTGLTANLLKLFEPRPPLEYKAPPEKRKCLPYTGMAQFVSKFAEPGDPEYAPPVPKVEMRAEKRARINKLKQEKGAIKAAEERQTYDPSSDPNITGDPYKTLFVAKLNYETTEHRIKREFEAYGPIKRGMVNVFSTRLTGHKHQSPANPVAMEVMRRACWSCTPLKVRMVTDKLTNKPRGYAFIEYMHTRDLKTAYKQADGRKLDNRRVLVDVERGRTVPNWHPRRLGGGLGSTRIGSEDLNQKHSGRESQQVTSGHRRSEEPRAREDRHVDRDREKSRERDRERDQERSNDRTRDRDPRGDRHHRDYDRGRDRDRERDRGRDRDQVNDLGRDYDRDRDRDRHRRRDRTRERDRDHEHDDFDHDRGRSRDRDYKVESRREQGQPRDKDDHNEPEHGEWYGNAEHGHGLGHSQPEDEDGSYNRYGYQNYPENARERYEGKEPDDYEEHYDHDES